VIQADGALVAIRTTRARGYPAGAALAPDRAYPERPFPGEPISPENHVYGLVRAALRDAGADAEHDGTARWNPLGRWIRRGDRVFVLPNFVMHRRPRESARDFSGKCTHASVVRAVLDYAVVAAGDPSLVTFGNAPIQGCDFDRVAADTGAASVGEAYRRLTGAGVGPVDLRAVSSRVTAYGALKEVRRRDTEGAYDVDLGLGSLLEPLAVSGAGRAEFRVGDYAPEATMRFHGPGRHLYVVSRRVLDADVIISVPKLKTHQKVGLTCALKGTVGAIARKECLAHHRRGAPERGGDEFPRDSAARDLVSRMLDRTAGPDTRLRANVLRVASKVAARALRVGPGGIWGGSWFGNDTAWRMALDIARILRFWRAGALGSTPARHHLVVVDGIVAGEGDGPLRPSGRPAGVVAFAADPCAADVVCARLMAFDPWRIPLVRESFAPGSLPLTGADPSRVSALLDGAPIGLDALPAVAPPPFEEPKGWRGRLIDASAGRRAAASR